MDNLYNCYMIKNTIDGVIDGVIDGWKHENLINLMNIC